MTKIPDAEFEIMKLVWENPAPLTTSFVMRELGAQRKWKIQTVVTLMKRLCERGFLRSEKHGKEREYYSLIDRDEYLRFETAAFVKQFHNSSLVSLVSTFLENESASEAELDELTRWFKERG
jgi:predicted transcriptional regulator